MEELNKSLFCFKINKEPTCVCWKYNELAVNVPRPVWTSDCILTFSTSLPSGGYLNSNSENINSSLSSLVNWYNGYSPLAINKTSFDWINFKSPKWSSGYKEGVEAINSLSLNIVNR